jgi:hypothetical protein
MTFAPYRFIELTMDRVRHFGLKLSKLRRAEKEQAAFQLHWTEVLKLKHQIAEAQNIKSQEVHLSSSRKLANHELIKDVGEDQDEMGWNLETVERFEPCFLIISYILSYFFCWFLPNPTHGF